MEARELDFGVLRKKGEYVQEEIVTTDRPASLMYLADKNKLVLNCKFEDADVAKSVPGRVFDRTWRAWMLPLEFQTFLAVKTRFTNLSVAENVQKWADKVVKRREELVGLKHLGDAEINSPNADKLYPFQRVGVNFIKITKKMLLGDDMGTGKTFQSISAMHELECERILVLAPKKPCKSWKDDIDKWNPEVSYTHLSGTSKRKDKLISEYSAGYMIMTYETAALKMEQLHEIKWDAIILDEGHLIKNRKTPRTIKIKELNYIPVKLILTGTPILNDLTKSAAELWSLLNFLYPEQFSSFWRFIDQHCVYEDGKVVALRSPDEFKAMLAPIMLRRLKIDVLDDLPEKTFMKQSIELYPAERKVLKQLAGDMEAELSNGEVIIAPLVVSQITRMKQCCISSRLLSKNLTEEHAEFKSAKLDAMLELIEDNMGGHKIVVFSQFYEAIRLASDTLTKAGIVHTELTGKMTDKQADASLERFKNNKNVKVMLCTIKAAGVGVDGLQVADIAIFLDRDWTPGINAQAEDRLFRIGQKNNVTIIKLVAEKSVEEYIEKLLADKALVFEDWIDGAAKVSVKDIRKYMRSVREATLGRAS